MVELDAYRIPKRTFDSCEILTATIGIEETCETVEFKHCPGS